MRVKNRVRVKELHGLSLQEKWLRIAFRYPGTEDEAFAATSLLDYLLPERWNEDRELKLQHFLAAISKAVCSQQSPNGRFGIKAKPSKGGPMERAAAFLRGMAEFIESESEHRKNGAPDERFAAAAAACLFYRMFKGTAPTKGELIRLLKKQGHKVSKSQVEAYFEYLEIQPRRGVPGRSKIIPLRQPS
jgi:hypothetical protein